MTPGPQASLSLFLSATGPLEERQIAYVCREALKVAGPVRCPHLWSPEAVGWEPR